MPLSAHPVEPGYSFSCGTLRVVKDSTEIRIAASPVPRAVVRRGRGSDWEPFLPEFRLVHPYRPVKPKTSRKGGPANQLVFDFFEDAALNSEMQSFSPAQRKRRAFEQFRFSLPKKNARILEPFRTHQWPLLVFLHFDAGAVDLAEANPALAFVLAQKLGADGELVASLRCSGMRQRDLLEILGLPSSPAAVNLFRKIDANSLNGDNWSSTLGVLRAELEEGKSRLNHLPSINSGVVEILSDPRASQVASVGLLAEVARDRSENYRGRVVHMITSTLRMQEELRIAGRGEPFPNLSRLRTVHDEVSESYRRRVRRLTEANQHAQDCFFNPPVPGIPGKIEPITSAADLVDEGELQGNCVASYASRVNEGTTFIYRVLQPERATLSLSRNTLFGDWKIDELEKRFNTDVSEETEEFVSAWLERHRKVQ